MLILKSYNLLYFASNYFLLKINGLYANCVMPYTHYISFIFVFKYRYINIYTRDRLDLQKEFKPDKSNLHNEITRY